MKSKLLGFLAITAAALTAVSALAEDLSKVDLKPVPRKVIEDPDAAASLLYKKPTDGRNMASVKSPCTDDLGVTYQPNSKGYSACLRYQETTKPEQVQPGQRGGSVGITFGK
jgi:hypothetical protein